MHKAMKFVLLATTAHCVGCGVAQAQQAGAATPANVAATTRTTTSGAQTQTQAPSPAAPSARDKPDVQPNAAMQTTLVGERESERTDVVRTDAGVASGQDDIQVTGSRLSDGDVTARKIVIDRAQIKARGVTSVEDLIRTLPQNVATIGAITNERGRGPLAGRGRGAGVSQLGSLGVSAANLGGIGAGNTLVLINGRRMAGAAGIEDGFVNLNGIPLSAIERVEIIPSGSAAVYGADALSGVINFILRKDARGLTLGSQTEFSSTGAKSARFNGYGSVGWGSGSISGTADYQRRFPVNNRKSGYVTNNYSDMFDNNPNFDFRRLSNGLQPGVIDRSGLRFDPATNTSRNVTEGLTVRPGLTGAPRISDFITVGPEALRDFIPRFAGPGSRSLSFTMNVDQKITDKLAFFATGLWNQTRNEQEIELTGRGLTLALASGQAYNPFPARSFSSSSPETPVSYLPAAEAAAGIIVPSVLRNTNTQWNVSAGLTYNFATHTRLSLIYNTSRSISSGQATRLQNLVSFQTAPDRTRQCYNFELARNLLPAAVLANIRAAFDRQCLALTSRDPNIAFNPFKSTADGSGGSIRDFLYNDQILQRGSRLEQYEARLTGRLMTLPAGGLTYAVGGEYATDGADSAEINLVTGAAGSRSRHAYFGEVSLPILGQGYDLPLMRALTFNLAGRVDTFKTRGPVGTVNGVPVTLGGELIYGNNTFSRLTPSFGIRYQPVSQITVLAKWGRGFQPPPYTQLFTAGGTQTFTTNILGDPFYTCTTDCVVRNNPTRGYSVPLNIAPNLNLRPQTSRQESFTASWQPTGLFKNFQFDATFNRTVIRNEYARLDDLNRLLTRAQALALPQFYPRDANGKVIGVQNTVFNIVGSEFKSMTYEASYFLMTGIGNFEPRIVIVDNLTARRQGFPNSSPISTLGTIQGPDNYRLTASLGYYRDHISMMLFAYHTPKYINDYSIDYFGGVQQVTPALREVDGYTTFDLSGSWAPAGRLKFNFAVRNIFNPKPPFAVTQGRPYDTGRWNAAGRTAMMQVEYNF